MRTRSIPFSSEEREELSRGETVLLQNTLVSGKFISCRQIDKIFLLQNATNRVNTELCLRPRTFSFRQPLLQCSPGLPGFLGAFSICSAKPPRPRPFSAFTRVCGRGRGRPPLLSSPLSSFGNVSSSAPGS